MIALFSLESFSVFSHSHLTILLIFAGISLGIIFSAFYLNKNDNSKLIFFISKALICVTIFQEFLDYTNRYLNGTLSLSVDLPLHICNYVLFLSIVAIYSKNKYLFNFCYFNAFSGALMANLTPDTNGIVGDWGLFFFFLHHFLIIINVLWMIFAFNMEPTLKGVFSTVLMLNVFALPIGLFNLLIGNGANYMYLCQKPLVENALLIGEWPFYIFALQIIGLIVFLILLVPFKVKRLFN